MLKLLAILLPFTSVAARRNLPDPEKGWQGPETPPEPDTRPPSEYGTFGNEDDDEDDLDREHDANDIMEVERENATGLRGGGACSPSPSLISRDNAELAWYRKLQAFLSPTTTQQDLEAYVPNYRYTPIFSGIFIPFSILLEIPGLTEVHTWYTLSPIFLTSVLALVHSY
jgi:hypothetical protein